jgi:hypothetical protein
MVEINIMQMETHRQRDNFVEEHHRRHMKVEDEILKNKENN